MSTVTVFNSSTGEIQYIQFVSDNTYFEEPGAGLDYITGEYPPEEYYIVNPGSSKTPTLKTKLSDVVTLNKTFIFSDGVDSATLTSVPAGTVAYITSESFIENGNEQTVNDSVVNVKTVVGGEYTIHLNGTFQYADTTFTFSAGDDEL